MKIHALASGSSGNCYCIETGTDLIFLDIGVKMSVIKEFLPCCADKNISLLVSHEHSDHISGIKPFIRKYNPKIYTSPATSETLLNQGAAPESIYPLMNGGYYELENFAVTAFDVPHDVPASGFIVMTAYGNVGLMTDCGCVTENQLCQLTKADVLILEANHDKDLLKKGKYPAYLKRRIASSKGHLSNEDAMSCLGALAGGNLHTCLLAHVSEENNDYDMLEKLAIFACNSYNIDTYVLRQKQYNCFSYAASTTGKFITCAVPR